MRKQQFLRLIIFIFLAQAAFVIYNNLNIYAADVEDVVTKSKDMRAGYEEIRNGNMNVAIELFTRPYPWMLIIPKLTQVQAVPISKRAILIRRLKLLTRLSPWMLKNQCLLQAGLNILIYWKGGFCVRTIRDIKWFKQRLSEKSL